MGFGSIFGKKKSEKTAKEAVRLAGEKLQIAKDQAKLFQPLFKQFSNLFTETTVEDIASGNVLGASTAAAVADSKRATEAQVGRFDSQSSKSGLTDSAAAIIRNNILTTARRDEGGIKARGRETEIDRRLRFLNFGAEANRAQGASFDSLINAKFKQADAQAQNEAGIDSLIGDVAGAGTFLATSLLGGPAAGAVASGAVKSATAPAPSVGPSRKDLRDFI